MTIAVHTCQFDYIFFIFSAYMCLLSFSFTFQVFLLCFFLVIFHVITSLVVFVAGFLSVCHVHLYFVVYLL